MIEIVVEIVIESGRLIFCRSVSNLTIVWGRTGSAQKKHNTGPKNKGFEPLVFGLYPNMLPDYISPYKKLTWNDYKVLSQID